MVIVEDKLKNMMIFVVDDDKINLKLINAILSQSGFLNIILLSSGVELLEAMKVTLPDLILLDIIMPKMDGYTALELIKTKEKWQHIPVIVITGLPLADDMKALKKSFDLGAMDYISKPFNYVELIMRVTAALRLQKQYKELLESIQRAKTLEKMISVCSYCKKVRIKNDNWQELDMYISEHTDTQISHSICPDCYKKIIEPQIEKDETED